MNLSRTAILTPTQAFGLVIRGLVQRPARFCSSSAASQRRRRLRSETSTNCAPTLAFRPEIHSKRLIHMTSNLHAEGHDGEGFGIVLSVLEKADTSASPAGDTVLTEFEQILVDEIERSRIAILGGGCIGAFVAHSLAVSGHEGAILLLLRTAGQVEAFEKAGRTIIVEYPGQDVAPEIESHSILLASQVDRCPWKKILNLIVCTKAQDTMNALKTLVGQKLIPPEASIIFLQNGLGLLERAKTLWPNESERPTFIVGVNTHGVSPEPKPFVVSHRGIGSIQLAVVPHGQNHAAEESHSESMHVQVDAKLGDPDSTSLESGQRDFSALELREWRANQLIGVLESSPALAAMSATYKELLAAQAEKMLVNCCINPITALLDIKNGVIGSSQHLRDVCIQIIKEGSAVIRALPTMRAYFTEYELQTRFGNDEQVWNRVRHVALNTAENISSMRADIRKGRLTEIDFLNNFIVQEGKKMKIRTPVNLTLSLLIKQLSEISQLRYMGDAVPNLIDPNVTIKRVNVNQSIMASLKEEERNFGLKLAASVPENEKALR